jgi:hypothetical protein
MTICRRHFLTAGDTMAKKARYVILLIVIAGAVVFWIYPRPTGYATLETPGIVSRLAIQRTWYSFNDVLDSSQGVAVLRADWYRPRRIELQAQKDGHTWRLMGSGPWGELSKVVVTADQTTLLSPGPVLKIKALTQENRGVISVDYELIGRLGEHYTTVVKDGTPVLPRVKIVDREGTVLSEGKFEFG